MSTLRTSRFFARVSVGVLAALLLVAPVAAKPKSGDGDGMPTGWERRNGLNVKRNDAGRDPDKDQLKNLREFKSGTDPQDEDTDGDGVPDGDEVTDGTDPLGEGDSQDDADALERRTPTTATSRAAATTPTPRATASTTRTRTS